MNKEVKLTQFAKGSGCGCKVSPAVLNKILQSNRQHTNNNLLIGNLSNDDAAVYKLDDDNALIVTADFFTPVVDDAYTFGSIAAANALSDVYAMGAKPITAIALLGWPVDKISADVASEVIKGATAMCSKAGIVISGGHTIDAPEPFFGLSVNGMANICNIKANNNAQPNNLIYLTKPLGTGIIATALKRGLLTIEAYNQMVLVLNTLNNIGEKLGGLSYVTAITDVTGYGLAGHLIEMCDKQRLCANINFSNLPVLGWALQFINTGILPDASYRNWNAYENEISISPHLNQMQAFAILTDPQTNGGLLVAVEENQKNNFEEFTKQHQCNAALIGSFSNFNQKMITVF